MESNFDLLLHDFYMNGNMHENGFKKYDPIFSAVRKENSYTSIVVVLVFKDENKLEIVHVNSDLNLVPSPIKENAKDLIYYVEKQYRNSMRNIGRNETDDIISEISRMYAGTDSSSLHRGIYRSTGEFDAILVILDSKNIKRVWKEKDKKIIGILSNLIQYDVLIEKLKLSKIEDVEKLPEDYNKKMAILSSVTNEYTSIYLIDYNYGYMSLYYSKNKNTFFERGLDYQKAIDKFLKNHKVVDPTRQKMVLNFKNVKQKLKEENDYFVNLKIIENNVIDVVILKFSIIKDGNRDNVILSIRHEPEEVKDDVIKKFELEEMIRYSRSHEPITGLYNRSEFMKKVSEKLSQDKHFYMISFDIDRFSVYNSYFGVQKGDELLRFVGTSLIEFDSKYDIAYAKLYNDIFLVLVSGNSDVLEDFIVDLKEKILSYDDRFIINISVGVFDIVNKEIPIMSMIDYSSDARKTVKNRLDKKYAIFRHSMVTKKESEQEVINNMDKGIEEREFTIYLQPKIDITNNSLVGAEALVRWIKKDRIIPPNEFIPVFEKNGFIIKLDKYVWEETVKYIKWRKDNNLELFPISVNVSRAFLTYPYFVEDLMDLTKRYGIENKYLELELTETIFASDASQIKKIFETLRSNGFKVLMDDFGSGYSSLNILKDIEFDILKIDMKFFSSDDARSLKIIETVINLAHKLEIPAVAEGVETKKYVDLLRNFGCRCVQGYYYSKPLCINDFNEYALKHINKGGN